MNLKEILAHVRCLRVDGPADREISGIAYDSRRVFPGMVFVAVRGRKVDGHDYIEAAIDRGARAVIGERNGIGSGATTRVKVPDSRVALAAAAAAYHGHPSRRLKVIGVTGTSGKTTVAFLAKAILEAAGIPCGLITTVCYEVGDRVIPALRTTPEAPETQEMLAQMARAGCRACLLEVSSHALDQQRVAEVEFDLGAFTNLSGEHLDYHGSLDNYFRIKQRLFRSLEQGPKPGAMAANLDDPFGARLLAESALERRLAFGFSERAEVRPVSVHLGHDGTRLELATPQGPMACALRLRGRHNVSNALAAATLGLLLDLGPDAIQRALGSVRSIPGRLEAVEAGQPFGVFVDYAHTADSLRHVLCTLREITPGRLLVVFGCGGNRDPGKRPVMGRAAAELGDRSILTSDNPRREDPARIIAQIVEGFRAAAGDNYRIELDRQRAIEEALRLANPGDTVVIAGKGHEAYQEYEDTVVPFDDRVCARETLATLGWRAPAVP